MKGKDILVTGGAGFIGSHLCEALIARDCNVTVVDNRPQTAVHLPKDHRMNVIEADVSSDMGNVKGSFDCIFHLAAYAVPTMCEKNPDEAFRTNVRGTYEVLKYASTSGSRKVVFTSSALLYGRQPSYLPIDEKHPVDGTDNVYSITKKLGEDICRAFRNSNHLSIAILRLFNTFGPRQTCDYLIPTIIAQAKENKVVELWSDKPTKDFNYVTNTVDALLAVAESTVTPDVLNVGSGEEINIATIAQMIAVKFGAEVRFLNREVLGALRSKCDYGLMSETFNWKPRVSFTEGLDMTIKYFENSGFKI